MIATLDFNRWRWGNFFFRKMKAILEILAVTNDFRIETNLKFTKQE